MTDQDKHPLQQVVYDLREYLKVATKEDIERDFYMFFPEPKTERVERPIKVIKKEFWAEIDVVDTAKIEYPILIMANECHDTSCVIDKKLNYFFNPLCSDIGRYNENIHVSVLMKHNRIFLSLSFMYPENDKIEMSAIINGKKCIFGNK